MDWHFKTFDKNLADSVSSLLIHELYFCSFRQKTHCVAQIFGTVHLKKDNTHSGMPVAFIDPSKICYIMWKGQCNDLSLR